MLGTEVKALQQENRELSEKLSERNCQLQEALRDAAQWSGNRKIEQRKLLTGLLAVVLPPLLPWLLLVMALRTPPTKLAGEIAVQLRADRIAISMLFSADKAAADKETADRAAADQAAIEKAAADQAAAEKAAADKEAADRAAADQAAIEKAAADKEAADRAAADHDAFEHDTDLVVVTRDGFSIIFVLDRN